MSTLDQSKPLKNKTILVTAAAQGIGKAVAEKLIENGAYVHASDINGDALNDLQVTSASIVDASDINAVQSWVNSHASIDAVVHAVGYVHQGSIEECEPDNWRQSMSITLDSAYHIIRSVVPKMKANGGSFVAIASVASSLKGYPRRAAYCAAKGGVIGLIKACAADYLQNKIRFNAVCPGTVDSPSLRGRMADLADELGGLDAAEQYFLDRQPSGRLGTPEDIAGMCAFLCADESQFITGQTINVDGGITI